MPDREALDACVTRLYDKIKELAHRLGWAANQDTLSTTALAHEAYLKLQSHPPELDGKSYAEIIAVFANAMRQILIDAARRKATVKRSFDALPVSNGCSIEDALDVTLALDDLANTSPAQARIAQARFLLGMTSAETAAAFDTPLRTVEREWQAARTFLAESLQRRTP